MGMRVTGWMLFVLARAVVWPSVGSAQEATVTGTVTDATGSVLPGVTVTAMHEATGNVFLGVTDGEGLFRIPVRVGGYQLTAELPGFATVTRTGISVLVGQAVTVNLEMKPSAVQETVTVTGEAPLVDVTQSRASGNIDPLQMQELPILGRDWQTLSLLALPQSGDASRRALYAAEPGSRQLRGDN
jgi:hypothetical protein